MPDLQGLDAFSQGFARVLFRALPALADHARADGCTLLVEVPSPVAGREGMLVSTEDDEVTVDLHDYHEHFGCVEASDEDAFEQATTFIGEILDEKLVVGVVMEGDAWRRSMMLEPGEWPEFTQGQRVILRSWRGTWDAEQGK